MNWQCPSTRAIASSIALPRRLRWAATSMNGMGLVSIRTCWFIRRLLEGISTGHQARSALGSRMGRRLLQAAGGDFKAADALLAGDRGDAAAADGGDEGLQLRPQRLGMADRQVAHRIAAVGLEAEALGHLPRQQVAHDILVARRHGDAAGLERREP